MTIKAHEKLLLTGAAGGLGKALRERLKANCATLRLSDRVGLGDAGKQEEIVLADLADAAAVDAMVQGVDAIVHLGGVSVEGPFGPILQANILGLYNLYEAARKHGVKRIVFASSNHVTGFYRQSETINADAPTSRVFISTATASRPPVCASAPPFLSRKTAACWLPGLVSTTCTA